MNLNFDRPILVFASQRCKSTLVETFLHHYTSQKYGYNQWIQPFYENQIFQKYFPDFISNHEDTSVEYDSALITKIIIMMTAINPLWIAKMHPFDIFELKSTEERCDLIQQLKTNLDVVAMYRCDLFAMSISRELAKTSKVWHPSQYQLRDDKKFIIDLSSVEYRIHQNFRNVEFIIRHVVPISKLTIRYEDFRSVETLAACLQITDYEDWINQNFDISEHKMPDNFANKFENYEELISVTKKIFEKIGLPHGKIDENTDFESLKFDRS